MYLICYDISNNNIRKKVADRLLATGYERLQLSVFIGIIPIQNNRIIWKNILTWLSEDGGKISIIKISPSSIKNMIAIGYDDFDVSYHVGEKHSLFF